MKKKQGRCRAGFTLVEIMIVIALIGLLAVIAIQGCTRVKENARRQIIVSALTNTEPVGQYLRLSNVYIQNELYNVGNLARAIHDYKTFKIRYPSENVLLVISEEPSLGIGYYLWKVPAGKGKLSTNSPVELK